MTGSRRLRWPHILAMALVCASVAAPPAYAQRSEGANAAGHSADVYWNQFRGPNGQGVMDAGDIPIHFGPGSNVLWMTPIDEGQSSPVIWGTRIFVTTYSPEDEDELTTVCIDRKTGDILWRRSVGAREGVDYWAMNGPASPTPAVDSKHVYVYYGTYGLLCYDHDGDEVWERRIAPPASKYGVSTSPILYEDTVILALDGNDGAGRILAVDRNTGNPVWEVPRSLFHAGWSTPMIWRHEGGDELVVLGSNRLTSYDPASGDEIWWAGGFPWETICVPVTGEGLLFVSSAAGGGRGEPNWDAEASWATTIENFDRDGDQVITRAEMNDGLSIPLRPELAKDEPGAFFHIEPGQVDGWLTNLDQDGDGALSKTDWLATLAGFALQSKPVLIAIRPSARGDARPSSVAWEIHTGIPEMPSPLYHQGNIYLVRNGGVLSCIKAADGSRVYRERIGAGGHYVASPIVVGEKLVTVSKRGTVTVIQVGDQLDVLATNDFGEETLATPAIAGNNLYLRTARRLYAIGE